MSGQSDIDRRAGLLAALKPWPSLAAREWNENIWRRQEGQGQFHRGKTYGSWHTCKFRIDRNRKVVKFKIRYGHTTKKTSVTYIDQGTADAPRRFFVCPFTLEPVDRLYFREEHTGGLDYYDVQAPAYRTIQRMRQIDRLKGRDLEGGPPRGAKRAELRECLRAIADDDLPTLKFLMSETRKATRKALAGPDGGDPLGTHAGLLDGLRDEVPFDSVPPIRHWEEARVALSRMPCPSQTPLTHPIAILEDHVRLDFRALQASGLTPGYNPVALGWATPASPLLMRCDIYIFPDGEGVALMDWTQGDEPFSQRLKITTIAKGAPSERYCAICPVANLPISVLALRAGRFAHPKAQRLVSRSQRRASP